MIDVSNNLDLSTLIVMGFDDLDVSSNPQLTRLSINYSPLDDLDISNNPNLTH